MKKLIIMVGILVFILIISTMIYGVRMHHESCPVCFLKPLNMEIVKHYIEGFGPLAILVYILLYIVNTITLIPPIAFMSLAAGALFGPMGGTIALTLGSFYGTTTTFIISRFFGEKFVAQFIKGKAADFNENLSKNGFLLSEGIDVDTYEDLILFQKEKK